MSGALESGLWGLLGGSALLIGAGVAYSVHLPQRLIAAIMAFGSGVLISAVAFDVMDEAYAWGGFDSTALGVLGGAIVYTAANAIGALLDGIPESVVIGVSLLQGGAVSMVTVGAVFLSMFPRGCPAQRA